MHRKNYFGAMNPTVNVLGGMAGSSMDGLDLAVIQFSNQANKWHYQWIKTATIPYPKELFDQLKASATLTKENQLSLDHSFGEWIAEQILVFSGAEPIDLAAIHGHTVTHDPKAGISWQLGKGETIAKLSGITTITDFRTADIALGGQGAPLVPFGDFELFPNFDACLNLGGICNISVKEQRLAWDISPCNQILNSLAQRAGFAYDKGGKLASQGSVDQVLLDLLWGDPYFALSPPKSLPNQYIQLPLFSTIPPRNGLRTYIQFLSTIIAKEISTFPEIKNVLISGGGAHNRFLLQELRSNLPIVELHMPQEPLISFKEALIFAFLGLKRFQNENNVLASVTGATRDSSSGVIHIPK